MVWGCFSYNGKGNLHFIDGKMHKFQYKKILAEKLDISRQKLGLGNGFLFQQDNEPKHKSRYAMVFFKENAIDVLEWSSQSPDLNPIDHIWCYIKEKVQISRLKNVNELKEKIKEE
ncbi:Transposable element Tcb2 transposase [Cucumispora dikerogammari]|nr:Transposable element Tcb2 transposase [Cucumispora dikerogammari]